MSLTTPPRRGRECAEASCGAQAHGPRRDGPAVGGRRGGAASLALLSKEANELLVFVFQNE